MKRSMFNLAKYFRRRPSKKYADRFIEGHDYRALTKKERAGKRHHKYEMLQDRFVHTNITGYRISNKYFELYEDGRLLIKKGYRWDGPSGVTVDTASFMRSSAVHDCFFQMLRENMFMIIVPNDQKMSDMVEWVLLFTLANEELRRVAKIDGMMWPRYHWVYRAVQSLGKTHALPEGNCN